MNLNLLVRGQSNAIMLMESNGWAGYGALQAEVQRLLGFDGVRDTVSIVYERYDPGTATAVGGTALVGDWLHAKNGDWRQGWEVGSQEQALLNRIAALDPAQRDDPTAVLWLHSEYDSANAGLTTEAWMSAVRFDAARVRSALGQSAADVPYLFVSAMPYWGSDETHQAIRRGMEALADDAAFTARIAARMLDTNIANDDLDGNRATPDYGGPHMDGGDALQTVMRAARAIAEQFASHAKPGSPAASGGLADQGPEVVQAEILGANKLRLNVAHDHASGFLALDGDAARGLGWSVQGSGGEVRAVSVSIEDADSLVVTFAGPLPAGGLLFYGYGYGRLAGADGSGRGNAVYDSQGMPIWVSAAGLRIGGAAPDPDPNPNPRPDGGLVLNGTAGNDVLKGGDLGDKITGQAGNDSLSGGGGADTLGGGDGHDTLRGGAGADVLYGAAGNDVLRGNGGNDVLTTGDGADRVVFGTGDGADRVTDFTLGLDTVQLTGVTAAQVTAVVTTAAGATGRKLTLPGGETLFLQGIGMATAQQLGLSGSFANAGGGGTPLPATTRTVNGTTGDDWLKGGTGADYLVGGAGSDDLQGLGGNDVLRGGRGDDGLTGGAGADTFCFARGDGVDWIVDFARGTDKLRLEGITSAQVSQHLESQWGMAGLAINLGQGDALFLQGVTTVLSASDMVFA